MAMAARFDSESRVRISFSTRQGVDPRITIAVAISHLLRKGNIVSDLLISVLRNTPNDLPRNITIPSTLRDQPRDYSLGDQQSSLIQLL